ncbi:mitotic spindle assembly checkpoint protein MAD1 isoform X1 [Hylaeus anthracinus]|uniref:mitotic spindle assembly checkpoint protein MAD1 isoform X1 n=1 Tax=Hylaeus anthracinus TaxID=313031 RepID=UPI0023B8F0AF|nr:mitotic spindle assembly checkpoint protein MAD1 isoform X1 [Hylaeus anthracinus]
MIIKNFKTKDYMKSVRRKRVIPSAHRTYARNCSVYTLNAYFNLFCRASFIKMDDKDPTSVIKMIKDLRSGSEAFRKSSTSFSLRLSGTTFPSLGDHDASPVTPKKRKLDDSNTSILNKSDTDVPCSPWEWRRLKGEVVSLRTRLSHQEAAVQKLHKIRREIEDVFEKEKGILEMQAEEDKRTIKQLEVRLDIARRTIQDARDAQAAAEKELFQVKTSLEQKTMTLMNENSKLLGDINHPPAEDNPPTMKEVPDTSYTDQRFEAAQTRIAQLEEKLKECRTKQQELELQNVELQNTKIKVERLESERALWEEGKMLTARAARANELEKELHAAKETINALRESVRGKLLLEEQMSSVTKRLEHTERVEQQVATLEAKKAELASRLAEYESIGITGGPQGLKRELNRLQQAELVLKAEEGQLRSKLDATTRESQRLSKNYEEIKKLATDVTVSKEKLNKLVSRLQKKMMLVTRERDSYRQQLDLYEKEITVDSNNAVIERIPALERTIDAYRELVAKLESDLQAAEGTYQTDECNKLRQEINQLKGELEHRALKGDFNCNARVLHFTMNPAAIAEQQAEEKHKALLREVEELRAKVAQGGASTTSSVLQTQEIAELKQTHEIKIARLKEAFKASSQEYRQACYQLFGWRVDRTKEGRYKLYSQYAESSEDFLFFHIGEDGVDLLETAFSATLVPLVEQYLQRQHSVPMFLNAVQTDLFNQQTIANVIC